MSPQELCDPTILIVLHVQITQLIAMFFAEIIEIITDLHVVIRTALFSLVFLVHKHTCSTLLTLHNDAWPCFLEIPLSYALTGISACLQRHPLVFNAELDGKVHQRYHLPGVTMQYHKIQSQVVLFTFHHFYLYSSVYLAHKSAHKSERIYTKLKDNHSQKESPSAAGWVPHPWVLPLVVNGKQHI